MFALLYTTTWHQLCNNFVARQVLKLRVTSLLNNCQQACDNVNSRLVEVGKNLELQLCNKNRLLTKVLQLEILYKFVVFTA